MWAASFVVIEAMVSATAQSGATTIYHHQNKGTQKGTFWVEAVTPSSLAFVGMVAGASSRIMDTTGCGVLDLGATEIVGSLEALEGLTALRHQHAAQESFSTAIWLDFQKCFDSVGWILALSLRLGLPTAVTGALGDMWKHQVRWFTCGNQVLGATGTYGGAGKSTKENPGIIPAPMFFHVLHG